MNAGGDTRSIKTTAMLLCRSSFLLLFLMSFPVLSGGNDDNDNDARIAILENLLDLRLLRGRLALLDSGQKDEEDWLVEAASWAARRGIKLCILDGIRECKVKLQS